MALFRRQFANENPFTSFLPQTNDSPFISVFPETNNLGVVTGQTQPVPTKDAPVPITTQASTEITQSPATSVPTTGSLPSTSESSFVSLSTAHPSLAAITHITSSTSSPSTTIASTKATSTSSHPPSTTIPARATSSAEPPGLSSSGKVGIGLGVPIGLIVLASIAFLIFRHWRYGKGSRLRHQGNIAAAGLYPVHDEGEMGESSHGNGGYAGIASIGSEPYAQKSGPHEIHGLEIPAHSEELAGSLGVRPQEL